MKLKTAETAIRPSKYGLGLFAAEDIPWGFCIGEYVGEIINDKEYYQREKYCDRIGVTYMFDLAPNKTIDGMVGGNETRFINHAPNGKGANATAIRLNGRIWFFSLDDIKKGKEISFDYGFQP